MHSNEAPKRKRHKWGKEPERHQYETIRTCIVCGLLKISDHNEWPVRVYFRDRGGVVSPMPECEMVE